MYPIGGISLSLIGFQSPVNGLFRVDSLLNTLPANLSQLNFDRLRLGGWHRLYNTE